MKAWVLRLSHPINPQDFPKYKLRICQKEEKKQTIRGIVHLAELERSKCYGTAIVLSRKKGIHTRHRVSNTKTFLSDAADLIYSYNSINNNNKSVRIGYSELVV